MTTNERIHKFDGLLCGVSNSTRMRDWLIDHDFFRVPASRKYHGAYEGGLFDHSLQVAQHLIALTAYNKLQWQRPESPVLVGIFHDLCKIDQYILTGTDYEGHNQYKWNDNQLLKGHGDKSIILLSQLMTLTEEEILCIRYHMGAFVEKEEWNDYTRAVEKYPNVLWTHHADMLASHVDGV